MLTVLILYSCQNPYKAIFRQEKFDNKIYIVKDTIICLNLIDELKNKNIETNSIRILENRNFFLDFLKSKKNTIKKCQIDSIDLYNSELNNLVTLKSIQYFDTLIANDLVVNDKLANEIINYRDSLHNKRIKIMRLSNIYKNKNDYYIGIHITNPNYGLKIMNEGRYVIYKINSTMNECISPIKSRTRF